MIKHIITAYNRVYFLQKKSLIIVHVFRGVKYCLNILHRRWIILEFLINTWMFDVYHLSACKPHVYYLYTTCTLPVNCRQRFKQEMMYSVHKITWAKYISLGLPDRGSNPRSIAFMTSTLAITTPMRLERIWKVCMLFVVLNAD